MNKALNCFWQTNVYKTAGYHNGRDHICAYIYICVCFLIVGDVLLTWYNSSNILYTHNTYINYVSILRCYPLRSLDMIQTNNELYANTSSTSHTALQPIYAIEFSFLLSYDHRILKSSNYLDSTYDCDHLNWFLGLFNHREKGITTSHIAALPSHLLGPIALHWIANIFQLLDDWKYLVSTMGTHTHTHIPHPYESCTDFM